MIILIINLNLENCYGIKKLSHSFNFDKLHVQNKKNVHLLYAPNGTMKTSLSKTFDDLSKGNTPSDLISPHKLSKCDILFGDSPIKQDQIFVIHSMSETYSPDEAISTFLARKELKSEYDNIYKVLEESKTKFYKSLISIKGPKNLDSILLDSFNTNFYSFLKENYEKINSAQPKKFSFEYKDIFNLKVETFLEENILLIEDYIEKYDSLIEQSTLFSKTTSGYFGTHNLNSLINSINDNLFFEAEHKLHLKGHPDISNVSSLKEIMKTELDSILADAKLKENFDKIDSKLSSNIALRAFKDILQNDPTIITLLKDYKNFQKEFIINLFCNFKSELTGLFSFYSSSLNTLSEIEEKAAQESSKWKKIINLFNSRFFVPFCIELENQKDVILNKDVPHIKFLFCEQNNQIPIKKEHLLKVLSNGEKRAFYILNILFEIEALKEKNKDVFVLFDDIADSFDYKNKFAIIEYLNDISEYFHFKILILTHNFDFYRNVASRINIHRNNCYMVRKKASEILIEEGKYLKDIFSIWKTKLHTNNKIFISCIPFVRNLIEYIYDKNNSDYLLLTNILHIKNETYKLTVNDITDIFNKTLSLSIVPQYPSKKIIELIIETANSLSRELSEESLDLENKIVLSIACRIKSEEFLIKELEKENINISNISKNQTAQLYKLAKTNLNLSDKQDKILIQVNLMTPENIHLNSFMYEPLLDTSETHLKELYKDICLFL